ncbi:MAG: hypothetical protein BGO39_06475 [Chloroflexi bacterium 54-19]|nr:MAG: hypothetical protein BGO39_06475 [Chloroflexi bacterium 54-19]
MLTFYDYFCTARTLFIFTAPGDLRSPFFKVVKVDSPEPRVSQKANDGEVLMYENMAILSSSTTKIILNKYIY